MKYIRNEIGRIEELLDETDDIITVRHPDAWGDDATFKMKKCWMVKQSENIEDLCDKWVFDNNTGEKNVVKDIDFASLETMKRRLEKGLIRNIRVATWTNTGLRFAAYMSDAGEWRLL